MCLGARARASVRQMHQYLIRLLVPIARAPALEILFAELANGPHHGKTRTSILTAALYFRTRARGEVCLPFHSMKVSIDAQHRGAFGLDFQFHTPSKNIHAGHSELYITGPGSVGVSAACALSLEKLAESDDVPHRPRDEAQNHGRRRRRRSTMAPPQQCEFHVAHADVEAEVATNAFRLTRCRREVHEVGRDAALRDRAELAPAPSRDAQGSGGKGPGLRLRPDHMLGSCAGG